jgi:hypothetical protein
MIDESDAGRLVAAHDAPGQAQFRRHPEADPLYEELGARQLGRESDLDEHDADLDVGGCDEHVGRKDHRDADADRRAVDRCNDRLRLTHQPDPIDRRRHAARPAGGVVARVVAADPGPEHLVHVGSGAEPAAGAGHDDRPDGAVVVRVIILRTCAAE